MQVSEEATMKPPLISFDWLFSPLAASHFLSRAHVVCFCVCACFCAVRNIVFLLFILLHWCRFNDLRVCFWRLLLRQCLWPNWKWHFSNDMKLDTNGMMRKRESVLDFFVLISLTLAFPCVISWFRRSTFWSLIIIADRFEFSKHHIIDFCKVLISQLRWIYTGFICVCCSIVFEQFNKQNATHGASISTSNKNCLPLNIIIILYRMASNWWFTLYQMDGNCYYLCYWKLSLEWLYFCSFANNRDKPIDFASIFNG